MGNSQVQGCPATVSSSWAAIGVKNIWLYGGSPLGSTYVFSTPHISVILLEIACSYKTVYLVHLVHPAVGDIWQKR